MATILNQATLTYTYGDTTVSTLSNLASTEWNEPLTLSKRALENAYRAGSDLTFLLSLGNSGEAAIENLVLTDDLGAFTPAGSETPVVPLTYTGPAELYLDGVFSETLTPTVQDGTVTFTIPELPAGVNAMLLYKVRVNDFAPQAADGSITNTVTAQSAGEPLTASYTVPAEAYADVTVDKEMTPNPVTDGAALTVTFTIENRGNTEATGLVLTDEFPLPLSDVSVRVNGVATTDFTFEDNVLTLPAQGASTLTVPAATFSRSAATGQTVVTPGVTAIELTAIL